MPPFWRQHSTWVKATITNSNTVSAIMVCFSLHSDHSCKVNGSQWEEKYIYIYLRTYIYIPIASIPTPLPGHGYMVEEIHHDNWKYQLWCLPHSIWGARSTLAESFGSWSPLHWIRKPKKRSARFGVKDWMTKPPCSHPQIWWFSLRDPPKCSP